MTGALWEPFDDNNTHILLSGIWDRPHAPMGGLVRHHPCHASWFTAHLTIYTADFGTREGRGCGQGEAEDRPRAGIVEFAHHGSSHRSFRCLVQAGTSEHRAGAWANGVRQRADRRGHRTALRNCAIGAGFMKHVR